MPFELSGGIACLPLLPFLVVAVVIILRRYRQHHLQHFHEGPLSLPRSQASLPRDPSCPYSARQAPRARAKRSGPRCHATYLSKDPDPATCELEVGHGESVYRVIAAAARHHRQRPPPHHHPLLLLFVPVPRRLVVANVMIVAISKHCPERNEDAEQSLRSLRTIIMAIMVILESMAVKRT